ncbi:hypothetical protein HPB51_000581 [Rhipicephalus microplus]|uniref:Uncharacterized protein n=1 Tax=Rhipicephalus microplus TaxID=6941 RepID=A0A9J6DS59_RHIMP|nr:hypothetical protein HPB51_000581 [Rhipicephalus microplus]
MTCEFGLNKLSFASAGAFIKTMKGVHRYDTLVIDKMKVRQAVASNRNVQNKWFCKLRRRSFSSYCRICIGCNVCASDPLMGSTRCKHRDKNVAPGRALTRIVLDAILQLSKHNVIVVTVSSDVASTNSAMWSNFGISCKLRSANHRVPHPRESNQSLFLCDVPHVVMCIRNHLLRHT